MSFDHNIFGVFSSAPGLWLMGLVVPLFILANRSLRERRAFQPPFSKRFYLFTMVAIAGLGQFLFLMVFFFGAERYIPDFYIPMVLGTAMLLWRIDEILKSRVGLRMILWLISVGLVVWTAGMGIFGGFGVPPQLFRSFNPVLYGRLASYWNDRLPIFFTLLDRVSRFIFNTPH